MWGLGAAWWGTVGARWGSVGPGEVRWGPVGSGGARWGPVGPVECLLTPHWDAKPKRSGRDIRFYVPVEKDGT